MIPSLRIDHSLKPAHRAFLDALHLGGFSGDIHTDYGTRLIAATDNSVYQIVPQSVICPRTQDDLILIASLLDDPRFHQVTVCARGGGTGTDGSALNDGIIVDVSRHMKRVLEINPQQRTARVEPGVTLAQLNHEAAKHSLFFAPNVAPSDRATIGGMISTDAAGEGSRVYGKTSNHIINITNILLGGMRWVSHAMDRNELTSLKQQNDRIGAIHRAVDDILARDAKLIDQTVPKLWRFASGYNLSMVRDHPAISPNAFNLNYLLSGAEGTLGFIAEATLSLLPLPKHQIMVVLKYAAFDDAVGAAESIAAFAPRSIETIDETILDLGRTDEAWLHVRSFLNDPSIPMRAINMVEFAGDDLAALTRCAQSLVDDATSVAGQSSHATGCCLVIDQQQRQAMWNLRKRSVGLLGNLPGRRKPIPFIEDAAVPPEHLREFVRDMRTVLDRYQLAYGIFGHVDVGCMHVRPALDLTDPADAALIRPLTDEVAQLVKKHGGILWGEHGKGFRSEYNPLFYGGELYHTMREIKAAFDPRNQFNPGKIATAATHTRHPATGDITLATIDAPTRGMFDRQIPRTTRDQYDDALRCNGNGQCFTDDPHNVMCPSWKGMGDRLHSPKGRASVFREWLRLLAQADASPTDDTRAVALRSRSSDPDDFSHEVYDAMQGCLACKACSGQCPVKVDVPEFRAAFLQAYHTRYRRPLRDKLIGELESQLPVLAKMPRLVNTLQRLAPVRAITRRFGLVDAPMLAVPTLAAQLKQASVPLFHPPTIQAMDNQQRSTIVGIVQDAFSTFYTPQVVLALVSLLRLMGYQPHILPYRPSGKGLHVRGYLHAFRAIAQQQADALAEAASLGVDLIGIDPAVTLLYRHEYPKALHQRDLGFHVHLPQEWLAARVEQLPPATTEASEFSYRLLTHCTERALTPQSTEQWRSIFTSCNMQLQPISAGCCGMGGAWGHEAVHYEHSRTIYNMSWAKRLSEIDKTDAIALTTGYSCHTQVKRFDQRSLQHPLEILATSRHV